MNNILIVEDNLFIGQKLLNSVKEINGSNNTYLANSLKEANSFLTKEDFKIIILDLKLNDGNGVELLKKLKEKKVKTKVYVFSVSKELKQLCLKYGATTFFDKAKDFDNLIKTIKEI